MVSSARRPESHPTPLEAHLVHGQASAPARGLPIRQPRPTSGTAAGHGSGAERRPQRVRRGPRGRDRGPDRRERSRGGERAGALPDQAPADRGGRCATKRRGPGAAASSRSAASRNTPMSCATCAASRPSVARSSSSCSSCTSSSRSWASSTSDARCSGRSAAPHPHCTAPNLLSTRLGARAYGRRSEAVRLRSEVHP